MLARKNSLINLCQTVPTLIFDLDNTLYPQKDFDRGAFEDVAMMLIKKNQYSLPYRRLVDTLMQARNQGTQTKVFNVVFEKLGIDEYYVPDAISCFRQHGGRYINHENSLRSLLVDRKRVGYKNYIVTNGPSESQQTKLLRLALRNLCEQIVICDSKYPEQLKPNNWAWNQLKLPSINGVVMVGDNPDIDGTFAANSGIEYMEYCFEKQYEYRWKKNRR